MYNVHNDKWYRIIGTLGGANTVYRVQLYIEANKHSEREASRRRNRIGSKQSVTVMETWSSREPFQYGRAHTHTLSRTDLEHGLGTGVHDALAGLFHLVNETHDIRAGEKG